MRVTADMEALEAFVAYARELRYMICEESCAGKEEWEMAQDEFDRYVEALDVSSGP